MAETSVRARSRLAREESDGPADILSWRFHPHLGARLAQVMNDILGVGVAIVDQDEHAHCSSLKQPQCNRKKLQTQFVMPAQAGTQISGIDEWSQTIEGLFWYELIHWMPADVAPGV